MTPQILFINFSIVSLCMLSFLAACNNSTPQRQQPDCRLPKPNSYPATVRTGAALQQAYSDAEAFFEGPTWDPGTQSLLFTAWKGKSRQILRLDSEGNVSVWLDQSGSANGTFLSNEGRLLTADVSTHRVSSYKISPAGPQDPRILAADKSWNQPNDVCQSVRGDIYFTDPNYRDHPASNVYWLSTEGRTTLIISDMVLPNGIVTNSDATKLYISDSHRKHWKCFDLNEDGSLKNSSGRVFFEPQTENTADPDGMTIDECDNLYFTGRGGLWCVSPEGKKLGFVPIEPFCSNVTFGGVDGRTLYITCRGVVYSLQMDVQGARPAETAKDNK